jgi:hypothetical protein
LSASLVLVQSFVYQAESSFGTSAPGTPVIEVVVSSSSTTKPSTTSFKPRTSSGGSGFANKGQLLIWIALMLLL